MSVSLPDLQRGLVTDARPVVAATTSPAVASPVTQAPRPTAGTPSAGLSLAPTAPRASLTGAAVSAAAASPRTATRAPKASPTVRATSVPAAARQRVVRAYVTGYTWYDNDPPGGAIADPVIHRRAGGTGTYADPITLAVAEGAFRPGTRMYIADLRRYFIVEDTCASCGQRPLWIDLWLDGRAGSAASAQACAERLTRNYSVVVHAGPGRPVSAGSLYGKRGCYR